MSEKYAVMPMKDYKDACDSLRKKLGTEDKIKSGDLKPLIDSIKAPVPEDQKWMTVNFYDYDGTLLYEYPLEEAHALTELPPLPSHEGLVCQGWNYTLEDIQEWDIPLDVGATYITEDESTKFVIEITDEADLSITLGLTGRDIMIDWGDSSPQQYAGTLSGSAHTYAKVGEYCISLFVQTENSYMNYTAQSFGTYKTANLVKHIYTGRKFNGYSGGSSAVSYRLNNLRTITLSNDVKYISDQMFIWSPLKALIIPKSVTGIGQYEPFERCAMEIISFPNNSLNLYRYSLSHSGLKRLCLPKVTFGQNGNASSCYHLKFLARGNASFGSGSAHYDCSALEKVVFSKKVKSMGTNGSSNTGHFGLCRALSDAEFPPISQISGNMFGGCRLIKKLTFGNPANIAVASFAECESLKTFDFLQTEAVPQLSVSGAFPSELPKDYEILVRGELYPMWKRATNWSAVASHIKPVGEYIFLEQGGSITLEPSEKTTVYLVYETSNGDYAENVSVNVSHPNLVSLTQPTITNDTIYFDVTALDTVGDVTITVSADLGGKRLTSETNISVFDVSALNYRVEAVEGATYGFVYNEDGWWESTNQGVTNSYSLCKIVFNVEEGQRVYLDCISYGDQYYSFGIVSKLDTALSKSYNTDSSDLYQRSFYADLSPNVRTIDYGRFLAAGAGEHFIYAKYKKQSGGRPNNDSLQFRLRIE